LPARGSAAAATGTTTINVADATGDTTGSYALSTTKIGPELDIVGAVVQQDRTANQVRASVTFAGPGTGVHAILRVALGYTRASGTCTVTDNWYASRPDPDSTSAFPLYLVDGTVHVKTALDGAPLQGQAAYFMVGSTALITGAAAVSRTGNTVTLATDVSAYLALSTVNCARVSVEMIDSDGKTLAVDTAEGFAPDEPVVQPIGVVPPPIGNATAQALDTDHDGVPDVKDVCPQVPGTAPNGCLTVPEAKSVVLGTKRVVIDRLIPLAATKCPAAATATAVLKGKTLGKGAVGVLPHGNFCEAKGVLKLKKKISKTRVTITGKGMTKFAITVKR
ncbi:MAG: hypothetical protein REI11_07340, partial [Patulibacter sp.]|nr:hypothetical protein [Patulibacter sp.]